MTRQSGEISHNLYRHFAADGALLYVGISLSAIQRLGEHKQHSHWFARIARVDIEAFADRKDAMAAERRAIQSEKPKHNIHHTKDVVAERKSAKVTGAQKSRDAIMANIVSIAVLYPEDKLPLPLRRRQIRNYMDEGRLGFIDLPNATGTKLKRYVTGWQLIDFMEWLSARKDVQP